VGITRRELVQAAGAVALGAQPLANAAQREPPWHVRTLRWGQTNLTEIDPGRIDIDWWRAHWKRTRIQGVVINAGGIVAYYPTRVPLHRRARDLGDRDLFGELARAAREDGLAVLARMDSNRADKAFLDAHPEWFARDARGSPYVVTGLYVACVNGPYYREYLPAVLREIVTRYHPDGVTDNNWNGPQRHQPCYCANCERAFEARCGSAIPRDADWDDDLYREWISWNYERRLEIWDGFNRVTRKAGGRHCLWVGMMSGSLNYQSRVFRDDREVFRRAELIMLDHQRRFDGEGFPHNAETGLRLRSVGGWHKVIPESMAMYHLGERNFRLAMKPEPEVRLWAVEGFAGGVQPWWHHVGAVQEDRRMFATAEPLFRWHEANQAFLVDRLPVARVGLVWSQRNTDFFGRDDGGVMVDEPWNGWTQALVRHRIPHVPVHAMDIERVTAELGLALLILPNIAALSDAEVEAIRRFVGQGGNLLVTGLSGLCDERGRLRPSPAFADLCAVEWPAAHDLATHAARLRAAQDWSQTYLRLPPEGARHELLAGFGGTLPVLRVQTPGEALLGFVPPVPVSPPEDVWMREPRSTLPGLVVQTLPAGSRIAYLPADLDRRFAREQLPDHGNLLARLVRWCVKDDIRLQVHGPGLIDCRLWRRTRGGWVLHLVNLNNANTWRTPVHELVPVGPLRVRIDLKPVAVDARVTARALAGGHLSGLRISEGWFEADLERIADHEVLLIEVA